MVTVYTSIHPPTEAAVGGLRKPQVRGTNNLPLVELMLSYNSFSPLPSTVPHLPPLSQCLSPLV